MFCLVLAGKCHSRVCSFSFVGICVVSAILALFYSHSVCYDLGLAINDDFTHCSGCMSLDAEIAVVSNHF